jgi:hypothetical protein
MGSLAQQGQLVIPPGGWSGKSLPRISLGPLACCAGYGMAYLCKERGICGGQARLGTRGDWVQCRGNVCHHLPISHLHAWALCGVPSLNTDLLSIWPEEGWRAGLALSTGERLLSPLSSALSSGFCWLIIIPGANAF